MEKLVSVSAKQTKWQKRFARLPKPRANRWKKSRCMRTPFRMRQSENSVAAGFCCGRPRRKLGPRQNQWQRTQRTEGSLRGKSSSRIRRWTDAVDPATAETWIQQRGFSQALRDCELVGLEGFQKRISRERGIVTCGKS